MRIRLGIVIAVICTTLIPSITPAFIPPFISGAVAAGGYASAPNSVTAAAIPGGVRVAWTAPSDLDTGVTGYRVEYSTSGSSGTWSLYVTVNSSTLTSDILGLSQIATYVRVAATTNAGIGTYGYPWAKIYGTTSTNRNSSAQIDYESGFGLGGSDQYTVQSSASFTRIKYRMDTTISGVSRFAETDFYEWARSGTTQATTATQWDPTVSSLMVPTTASYTYNVQANVTDLNIYSNHPGVTNTNGSTGVAGRLEIWPWNYGPEISTLTDGSSAGSGSTYDYNDTPAGTGSYGSFQIHDLATYKPVFVWNNQGNGVIPEISYGKNTGTHPDWTFCSQGNAMGSCPTPSYFRLQIYVNIPITPQADATPPTVSRIDAKTLIRNGETISVRSNEIGTVYLVRDTVTVTNLASITNTPASLRNSVSISTANTTTTLTTSGLQDGTYSLYAVDSLGNVSIAISSTVRLDSTAPVALSLSVSSQGNAILLTVGETVTLASFASGAYSISDSGSALSISSASVAGQVVTLNLSRSIPAGAAVTFSYSPSLVAVTSRWVDAAGNELSPITLRNITNNSSTPISITLTAPSPLRKGVSVTVTATVSVAGRVSFTIAGKRVAGCLNKIAAGTTPISVSCTFKPALSARQTIAATLIPTLGFYPTTSAAFESFILQRSTLR